MDNSTYLTNDQGGPVRAHLSKTNHLAQPTIEIITMTTTPVQMGAANNGGQNNSNTSNPKKKWTNKKKNQSKNKNKSKGKGFSGTAKDRPMAGIVLTTNRTIPLSGLYKTFIECAVVAAGKNGLVAYSNSSSSEIIILFSLFIKYFSQNIFFNKLDSLSIIYIQLDSYRLHNLMVKIWIIQHTIDICKLFSVTMT